MTRDSKPFGHGRDSANDTKSKFNSYLYWQVRATFRIYICEAGTMIPEVQVIQVLIVVPGIQVLQDLLIVN